MFNKRSKQQGQAVSADVENADAAIRLPRSKSSTAIGAGKAVYETLRNPRSEPVTGSTNVNHRPARSFTKSENAGRKLEGSNSVASNGSAKQQRKDQDHKDGNKSSLSNESWIRKKGHTLTYLGIFLFTATLYFRPYELFPSLSALDSIALILAVATLLVYVPSQLLTEGDLTAFTTEVKCVLFLAAWALLTIPIAKDPGLAWDTFINVFGKVALVFIIMVNTVRTRLRMFGLIWLAIGVGLMLSYQALDLYQRGEYKVEGYRVGLDLGGMFGNPNDLAMHLAIFIPVAVALGLASRSTILKIAYFVSAIAMLVGNMVTQSRGGFLGLLTAVAVLVWKLGRKNRLKAVLIFLLAGTSLVAFAPNNYGVRMMSIFNSALDPVGSTNERTELLKRSVVVTLRNPWGIGLGNFPVVGQNSRQTHNAYTQVSAELGLLCLAAYLILLISPFRKLGVVTRELTADNDHSWIYYLSIGVQASIAAYMVASFFGSVAYHWYIYYPLAFAVCIRRLYWGEPDRTGRSGGDYKTE